MSQLTVVLYMFVDIILCWKDLANGSQESLEIHTEHQQLLLPCPLPVKSSHELLMVL